MTILYIKSYICKYCRQQRTNPTAALQEKDPPLPPHLPYQPGVCDGGGGRLGGGGLPPGYAEGGWGSGPSPIGISHSVIPDIGRRDRERYGEWRGSKRGWMVRGQVRSDEPGRVGAESVSQMSAVLIESCAETHGRPRRSRSGASGTGSRGPRRTRTTSENWRPGRWLELREEGQNEFPGKKADGRAHNPVQTG